MFQSISLHRPFLLMTSLVTLVACSNKQTQTITTKEPTVQSSSQEKLQRQQSTRTGHEVLQATPEESTQAEVSDTPEIAPSETATAFDMDAIVSGDYTSLVGTWSNSQGKFFTVTAEGILYFGEEFDDNQHHKIESSTFNDSGRIGGSLGYYNHGERQGGAHISIVPAGVANINDLISEHDHIEIGHDISSGYPEQQYFRQ